MTLELEIGGSPIEVEVAADDRDRYIGLSNTEKLDDGEGMLFIWPLETKQGLTMRDMDFPIDTIFASKDGTVRHIETLKEDGQTSSAVAQIAVEAPAGFCEQHNVETGDKITRANGEGLTKQSETDEFGIEIPDVCRECGERTRMQGNFRCPQCHPDVEEGEEDEHDLVKEWENAIAKPFADYDSMEDCMDDHSDKDDPGAYCAQIHYNATGEWPAEKSNDYIVWTNVGGDPFRDYEVLEEFCEDLEAEGGSVLLGDEPWEHATGHHGRPVKVYGLTLDEAEDVWSEYEEEAAAIGGPKAKMIKDRPDEHRLGPLMTGPSLRLEEGELWCPEDREVYRVNGPTSEYTCPGCDETMDGVDLHADINEKQEEDFARDVIVEVDNVHEAPQDKVVHHEEDIGLYYVDDEAVAPSEVEEMQAMAKVDPYASADPLGGVPDEVIKNVDTVDQAITRAIKSQVWPDDLSKQERTWANSEDVPDFVKRWIDDVIEETDPMYDEYDGVPSLASLTVQKEIKDSLTQPQGWSLRSIKGRLVEEFDWMDKDQAENIARQEVAAVLNTAKSVAFRAAEKEDELHLYDWVGPDDQDTSHICTAIKSDLEDEGGKVPFSKLESVMRKRARQFEDSGGTPHRVEQLVPHFGCRHTVELVEVAE